MDKKHVAAAFFFNGGTNFDLYRVPGIQNLQIPPPIPGSPFFLDLTPPKFNIAPEKSWLEDYFLFGMVYFHGLC